MKTDLDTTMDTTNKGSYILIASLPINQTIHVGKLGEVSFSKGFYAYVGSAMNGLDSRIGRHLQTKKNIHWHIDYLLQYADITDILYCRNEHRLECQIAQMMSPHFSSINRFGCSDCRCHSHLIVCQQRSDLIQRAQEAFVQLNVSLQNWL
ncbi:MAG: GIY-YIG nuclease family protein [Chloroflexota bacterium]|nr:GIY-YIG nuclease family protein [Chloroflexota bacterium]